MLVLGVMGSPRKQGNTARLMQDALNGAAAAGAATRMIYLTDLRMKGCQGCYACKQAGAQYGRCILQDDMTPLYREIEAAQAVIFGSPVYFGAMTAELKMVIDRLFAYITLDMTSLLPEGKGCGLIFTQNQRDPAMFEWHFLMTARILTFIGFNAPEILVSVDTIGYEPLEQLPGMYGAEAAPRKRPLSA